jgi:hypothetical protein
LQELAGLTNPAMPIFGAGWVTRKGANLKLESGQRAKLLREQVQAEYEAVWRNLDGRPIESLIGLPLMTDPELQA